MERDLLYFLEFDNDVIDYHAHPFTISSVKHNGMADYYTPNFQVIRTDAKSIIVCKPTSHINDPNTKRQIALTEAWAATNDHDFVLITDSDLREGHRLANLKLLWRYSRLNIPYAHIAQCLEMLNSEPAGLPLGVITSRLANIEGSLVHAPTLYHLLFKHILVTNLENPLTPASKLWLPIGHN